MGRLNECGVVFIGAGGHCFNIAEEFKEDIEIVGCTDIDKEKWGKIYNGIKVLGDDLILQKLFDEEVKKAHVTLGSIKSNQLRKKLYLKAIKIGFEMINLKSKHSKIAKSVEIGNGNTILPGVIINSNVKIKNNNIINTGALIEHDSIIGSHVHIAPRSTIGGGVKIEDEAFIGIGSTIIQGVKIGKGAVIAAGAVVIEDVPEKSVVAGVPAKIIKYEG